MAQKIELLYPCMAKKPPFTVDADGYEPVEGETIPRRHPLAKHKLISRPSDDVATVFDILKRGADKFGNAKAVGTRRMIKTHQVSKKVKKTVDGQTKMVDKKWTYFELSGYSYISFVEYEKLALQIGAGFRSLGMNKGDRVHLFAATRYTIKCDSLYVISFTDSAVQRTLARSIARRCVTIHANSHRLRHTW